MNAETNVMASTLLSHWVNDPLSIFQKVQQTDLEFNKQREAKKQVRAIDKKRLVAVVGKGFGHNILLVLFMMVFFVKV